MTGGTGTEIVMSVLAMALIVWPASLAAGRIRRIHRTRPRRRWSVNRLVGWTDNAPTLVAVMVGLIVWPVSGGVAAIAFGLLSHTGCGQWRAHRQTMNRMTAMAGFGRALGMLAAELRAGAHPAAAAEGAAVDIDPISAEVLLSVAGTARLGGDVADALQSWARDRPEISYALRRVGRAWALAERTGIGLAELLDSIRGDLEHRVRFGRTVAARMAGPRTSALVLGALPILGIGLGELIGARPWRVLTEQSIVRVLLLVGVSLICVGLAWSRRLTSGAVT